MIGKQLARLLTDVTYPEGENELREVVFLGILYSVYQILGGFILEALKGHKILFFERINIARLGQQPARNELLKHGVAHTLDIHCVTGAEMDEVTQKLRRALWVDASDRRLALLTDNGSAA